MIGQKDSLRWLQERFYILFILVTIAFVLIFARVSYLQLVNGKKYRFISDRNSLKEEVIPGPRGQIVDRDGRLMVDNRLELDLQLNRQQTSDPLAALQKISKISGLSLDDLKKEYAKEARQKQPFETLLIMRDIPREAVTKLESHKTDLEGVSIESRIKRVYLMKENASHVFGYTGLASKKDLEKEKYPGARFLQSDTVGKYGLERYLDSKLRGREGVRYVVVDAHGKRLKKEDEEKVLGDLSKEADAKSGSDLQLTIDADLQEAAQISMKDMIGAVVAINPKTGEILTMHSQPGFDPTELSLNKSKEWDRVFKSEFGPLRNKVIQDYFSPGSTFKTFSSYAGLKNGLIDPYRKVFCNGTYRLGNRVFHCSHKEGHGWVNLRQALQKSCNIYFYELADRMPSVDMISEVSKHFGFGREAGLGMEKEAVGILPSEEWKLKTKHQAWTRGETLMVAIGQSFTLTTPIQLAYAYGALLNGGHLMKPYLVKEVRSSDGRDIQKTEPKIIDTVDMLPEHLKRLKEGLSDVMNEPSGTGYYTVRSPLVKIGGKSGTVSVASSNEKDLFRSCEVFPVKKRPHAWFVGYAPEENPEIVVAVFAMHACFGAVAAGPVVKSVIEKWYEKNKASLVPVSTNKHIQPDVGATR